MAQSSKLKANILFEYAVWGLFLLVIFPIVGLAYYNHPSVGDDYCFSYMTRDYGYWEAQHFYYNGWSGRYLGNMFFHANPMVYGNYTFVKILPLLIIGLMLHANYFLWKALFPAFITRIHWAMVLLFNAFYISQMPSLVDNFYWYSAVFIYPFTMAYWQYFISYSIWYYEPTHPRSKYLVAFFLATMVFFIVGSNEMMMLFILGFMALIFGYQLLFERKINWLFLILLVVGLCSAVVVVKAPGVAIRMNGDGLMEAGLGRAINSTLHSFLDLTFQWLFKSPLLLFTLIFGYLLKQYQGEFHHIFKIQVWVGLVAWLGFTMMMLFAIHYGNNMGVPTRVTNIIYEFFVLGLCYNITLWQVKWDIFGKLLLIKSKWILLAVGVFFMLIAFGTSSTMKVAYKELLKGTAKGYDQEMLARYELISASKSDTVYVPALKNKPTTLYFDEIKDTEKHLWNKCYAEYFKKKVIILKEN